MDGYVAGLIGAVWLGILTSISPCPLATNIAAVSFIGRRVESPRSVLLAGLSYALGRLIAYLGLGMIVVGGLLSIPGLSFFLQNQMNKVLGPLLIIVGVVLLGLFKFSFGVSVDGGRLQKRMEKTGLWGAGLLGLVFALSFCPVSAALFFGSLIPLSVEHQSTVLFPSVYGVGTALPVLACAFVLAFSTRSIGALFNKLTAIEKWVRKITGVVFIIVGLYLTLVYIFHLLN